jgi:diacylglycerol O-acyltransferase / wax synthase
VVGGSLRDYLLTQGKLPEEALRAFMAVSLRTAADDEFSNKITTRTVTLATDVADPLHRLRAIAQESNAVKKEAHGGGRGMMEIVQILPPLLVSAMTSITPPDQIARMMGANVVVSNIRGSAEPLYIAGARVLSIYPMSIIAPGGGLNITCISYADEIDFGVTIDPDMFPDPWRIIDGLHKALGEYLVLARKKTRRRKKNAVSSRVGKKKRPVARSQSD